MLLALSIIIILMIVLLARISNSTKLSLGIHIAKYKNARVLSAIDYYIAVRILH